MKAKNTLIIALTWACSLLLSCSGAWAWQANIKFGWANPAAVDPAGNVVAAGVTDNSANSNDFTVVKFDGGEWAGAVASAYQRHRPQFLRLCHRGCREWS
jgi:hypothetical protein